MFLDTANTEKIKRIVELRFLEGVTTNPTILLKQSLAREIQLKKIASINKKITFVQLVGSTSKELWDDYRELVNLKIDTDLGVKVSIDYQGLKFIKELKEQHPNQIVLGTAIYSTEQGMLGALSGCDYLAPYINRMLNNNIDPFDVITNLRVFIDKKKLNTKIMGASFKNTKQIIEAYTAGADTVTVPSDLMEQMISKTVAEDAIKVFNEHGRELEKIT